MAASKLTPRKLLESQRSGKLLRKAFCGSEGQAISLLLACSAGVFLLCFMFVDVKTFYDRVGHTKPARDFLLQRETLGTTSLSSHESEAVTEPRTSPPTEVNLEDTSDAAIGEAMQSSIELASITPTGGSGLNTTSDAELVSEQKGDSEESASESEPVGRDRSSLVGCDIYHGQWVYDDAYPLYRSRNCPFVDTGFRCEDNGRPDQNFMKYRWQPHGCDLPR